jgi:hypothetical protein
MIFVRGSMASHSHNTCVEQRSLVRSSSSWRCGSRRWQKERSCKVCACEPARVRKAGDGGLPVAEDSLGSRRVQPFSERRQHHPDLLRGGFQAVQGSVAPSTESGATSLAAKGLNLFSVAMGAISDQSVDVSVCDPGIRTCAVRTGEALGVHPLWSSPPAFDFAPGAHRERRRLHHRREGAGEATDRAIVWGARLEKAVERGALGCCRLGRTLMGPATGTQPHERANEEEHKQKQEYMKGHTDPHRLKLG